MHEREYTGKFNVGDKVKFKRKNSSNAKYFRKGLTGLEIARVNLASQWYVVWESDRSDNCDVFEEELELEKINWREMLE